MCYRTVLRSELKHTEYVQAMLSVGEYVYKRITQRREPMGHDPRAVANKLIEIGRQQGIALTPMQLIKLVFFAHGWMLGLYNRSLINRPVQAWQYGPVIPEVYWAFNRFGRHPISDAAKDQFGLEYRSQFSPDEVGVMRSVVNAYGKHHAYELSDLTHQDGTPWKETFKSGVREEIPNERIHGYFKRLAKAKG